MLDPPLLIMYMIYYSDLASMDELGYIYIYGRLAYAQRWKVASDVVYSLGIETVLRSNPNISACAVRFSILLLVLLTRIICCWLFW